MVKKKSVIVFASTFVLFFAEAIIHYNVGRPEKCFVWPDKEQLFKLIGTMALFSFANSILVHYLEKKFSKKSS